jgi:hypothetical protein
MKNIFALLLAFFIYQITASAQAPQGVNYQAVARDLSGNPLITTAVTVQYDIRQGSSTGTVVYSETHSTSTNQFGLFTAEIGAGTPLSGTFPGITWGAGVFYLEVTINGDVMPATQLLSVPYALHANTATSGTPGANGHANLADSVAEPAGSNCINGGYLIHMGADDNDDGTLQPLERDISYYICNGIDGVANNNDTSATNEIQTLSISNDTIFLSNGGFVVLPSVTGDSDWAVNGNDMNSMPTGNVGIGTTTPGKKVSIETNSTSGDGISINNSSTGNPGVEFQTLGTPRYVMGIDQSDNNKFKIGTTNLFTNTRLTISPLGDVGIGTPSPLHRLSVVSTDSVIASFTGLNPAAAIISVANVNPNAATGAVFLTGADSGIVAIDPTQNTFFLSNTTVDGHVAISADSTVATYGKFIYNASESILNETDSMFTYSSGPLGVFNVNQGTFVTDSLYVVGANVTNPGWVLANDGFGQAVWTNPSAISGSSLWNTNGSGIDYTAGNVGIGTINPQQNLTISTGGSTTLRLERSNASAFDWEMNVDNLGFHLKGGADAVGPGLTDFMNIDGTGRVGLGITTPTQKLHILGGTIRIDDGTNPYNLPAADGAANQVLTTNGAGVTSWQTPSSTSPWTRLGVDIFQTTLTDFVGIGTNTPTEMLSIGAQGTATSLATQQSSQRIALTGSYWNGSAVNRDFTLHTIASNSISEEGRLAITWEGATPNELMSIANTGFVGIGTTNPLAKLHVADNASVHLAAQASNSIAADESANLTLLRTRGSLAAPTQVLTNDRIGKVEFIGMDNTSNFQEAASIRAIADENFGSTSHGTHLEFHTSAVGGGGGEVMRLADDGHVGIGTGNPLEKLHIQSGTIRIDDGSNPYTFPSGDGSNNQVLTTDGAGNVTWQNAGSAGIWKQTGTEIMYDAGNVGIGLSNPGHLLHLQDSSASGATPLFVVEGNIGMPILSVQNNQSIGIGTNTPSSASRLTVLGSGNGSTVNVQDQALSNGSLLYMESNSAFGTANNSSHMIFINRTGANNNTTHTAYGVRSSVSNSGVSSINIAGYFSAANAGTNWAGYFNNGNVYIRNFLGLGTVAPTVELDVAGDLKLVNGSEGAGKVLVSDAAGLSTWKENQLAFEALINNSITVPLGTFGGGSILLPFATEMFDDGSIFDPAIGVHQFVAKVAGVYTIQTGVTFAHLGGGEIVSSIGLVKNGASNAPLKTSSVVLSSPGQRESAVISITVRLSAGDFITVEAVTNTTGTIQVQTLENNWFSGHMVYAY